MSSQKEEPNGSSFFAQIRILCKKSKGGITVTDYQTENINQAVLFKNIPVMSLDLNYPKFSETYDKNPRFVAKINSFYAVSAQKYLAFFSEKYSKKAYRIFSSHNQRLSFSMNCTVAYSDEKFISVFADLAYFNGKSTETLRFSQLWSREAAAILPASRVFSRSRRQKNYLVEIISAIADNNMKNGFAYRPNYRSVIRKKFDFSDFYLVPKGVAFFFSGGVLSAEPSPCVFVVPTEKIDGLVKIVGI